MEQMTLVEINSTSGAFMFKSFKGDDSLEQAQRFSKRLKEISNTLSVYIIKTIK